MAELRMTNKDMKSVSGQRNDKTLTKYIESADRARFAEGAMAQLSAWKATVRNAGIANHDNT